MEQHVEGPPVYDRKAILPFAPGKVADAPVGTTTPTDHSDRINAIEQMVFLVTRRTFPSVDGR